MTNLPQGWLCYCCCLLLLLSCVHRGRRRHIETWECWRSSQRPENSCGRWHWSIIWTGLSKPSTLNAGLEGENHKREIFSYFFSSSFLQMEQLSRILAETVGFLHSFRFRFLKDAFQMMNTLNSALLTYYLDSVTFR